MNPTVAQVYFNLALCYDKKFEFKTAIEEYSNALYYNPEYSDAYKNRGFARVNAMDTKDKLEKIPAKFEDACTDFQRAKLLGDKSMDLEDMMFIYCKGQK